MRRRTVGRILNPCVLLALTCGLGVGLSTIPQAQADNKTSSAQKDVDFGPYMAKLQRQIKRSWFPPRGSESKRVVVVFKLNSEGIPSDVHTTQASGDSKADEAAIDAVKKATPFDKLPAGSPAVVDIQFTYDYNVFAGGKKAKTDPLEKLKQAEAAGKPQQIIESLVALADDEVEKDKNDEAMTHYKRAIELLHKNNPLSEDYLAKQLTALGDLYYDIDDYESCQPLYEECLEIRLKNPSSTSEQLGPARRDMAYTLLYLEDGDVEKARALFGEALADAQKSGNHDLAIDVQQGIAHCHWKNGEYAKALPLYKMVLNQKKNSQPDDYVDLGYRSKDVADCLYELKNYRESLPYFRDAQTLLEKAGKNDDDDELADAREKVIELCARLGIPNNPQIAQIDEQKKKETDKAYSWLPYALGGSLLALLVIAISNRKNNTVDIAGRDRKR